MEVLLPSAAEALALSDVPDQESIVLTPVLLMQGTPESLDLKADPGHQVSPGNSLFEIPNPPIGR